MNSALVVSILITLIPGFLLITPIYSVTVKLLERRLTFAQSLLISAVGSVVSIAIYTAYTLAKAPLGLSMSFDAVAAFLAWSALGIVITRLASNYGIKKEGWFGVGGKANLWLLALSWVIVGAVVGVQHLLGS